MIASPMQKRIVAASTSCRSSYVVAVKVESFIAARKLYTRVDDLLLQ